MGRKLGEVSLECAQLNVTVAGRILVRDLNLRLEPGDFTCVLGPNGVGKTLTLLTMAGLREPDRGEVRLSGVPLAALDRRRLAKRLGMLPQHQSDAFPTTALETAVMGRYSRTGLWQWDDERDRAIAADALRKMDLAGFEERMTTTLSGGERRRVGLATLLVQDPDILLLDEPLNHLDPMHKLGLLDLLESLTQSGKIVVASLHDPTLAARFATHILLLSGDGNWQHGTSQELLNTETLQRIYGTRFGRFARGAQSVLVPIAPC